MERVVNEAVMETNNPGNPHLTHSKDNYNLGR